MSPCFRKLKTELTENGWQLAFVFCKRKTETAYFPLFAGDGNGKQKCVFLGRQMIIGKKTIAVTANVTI
jgi:hypothetical protein